MTSSEKDSEIKSFAQILDALACPYVFFATDKVEALSEIRSYYASLPITFAHLTSDIIAQIDNSEVKSASVQRAYYFIYKAIKGSSDIYNILVGKGYQIDKAEKQELGVLMRNFFVREFVSHDVYTVERELMELPEAQRLLAKRGKDAQHYKEIFERERLRRILPHRMDFGIFHAEQSGYYRKTIMLKNFPSKVPRAALTKLGSFRGTSMTIRYTPMSKGLATKLVDNQMRNNQVKFGGKRHSEKAEASQDAKSIATFYESILENKSSIFHINVFIECVGKTKKDLDDVLMKVNLELASLSITYDELKYEQRDAFLSLYPMSNDLYINESNNMPSYTAACLYPASHSDRLDSKGMFLGQTIDGGNMFVDFWLRNRLISNGNFNVTGKSGQGKSWLMKKIITFQYMAGTSCFVLDPDDEVRQEVA